MISLQQLQSRMESGNESEALQAATDLSNFYFIYNEEYNGLQAQHTLVSTALVDAKRNPEGVDQHEVLRLEAAKMDLEGRMAFLDYKMEGFHNSGTLISPPSQTDVDRVKQLSALLSQMTAHDRMTEGITAALIEIGSIVSKTIS